MAAAVLALVGLDGEIAGSDVPAGVLLVVLGVVGSVFTLKHYERFRFQASQYREALDVSGLAELRRNARGNHESAWSDGWRKPVRETHLHWWWAFLHLAVSGLGGVVVVLGLVSLG